MPEGTVRFSHTVVALVSDADHVTVTAQRTEGSSDEMSFTADVVIAADGINSFVRQQLLPQETRRWASDLC